MKNTICMEICRPYRYQFVLILLDVAVYSLFMRQRR